MTATAGHTALGDGRWFELTLLEQMGNIGSEVGRALQAKQRQRTDRMWRALDRALELFDLTLRDPRHAGPRRREIARAREAVLDHLVGDNMYGSDPEGLDKYFLAFASAARRAHHAGTS
jgi:hypothetical protein